MNEFSFPLFLGCAMTALVGVIFFHEAEAQCQKEHNVHDCEWTRSPFTPVAREANQ